MSLPPKNLAWSLLKNAGSQAVGRLFLSVARFGVAVIIVRYAGAERFGEYAVALTMLAIAEWGVDFGFTDIAVRNMCRSPERHDRILKLLWVWKLVLACASWILMVAALYALAYPTRLVMAGVVGGLAIVAYAGVLVYRASLRSRMLMERDVFGEIIGVLVMLPLIWWTAHSGGGVEWLVASYAASRLVYLAVVSLIGGHSRGRDAGTVQWIELRRIFREALPLGVAGLLVCASEGLAPILLSKLLDMRSVAIYSVSLRFVLPAIIIIQSIASAFYPVLSSFWAKDARRFADAHQVALEASMIAATALFCAVHGSSAFLMGLLGPQMQAASAVLDVLSWLILAKAVTTLMAPLIIVSDWQRLGLWLTAVAVLAQFVVLILVVPRFGVYGAAVGHVAVDVLAAMVPTIVVAQRVSRRRVQWNKVVRIVVSGMLALVFVGVLGLKGSLLGGAAAVVVFMLLAFFLGGVSRETVRRVRIGLRSRWTAAPEQ